jgi:AraC family transcriptional regulator
MPKWDAIMEPPVDPVQPFDGLVLLHSQDRRIPGSWQYSLRRYLRPNGVGMDDSGTLSYRNDLDGNHERRLDLTFRLAGRAFTPLPGDEGESVRSTPRPQSDPGSDTLDILHFRFEPSHLALYARGAKKPVAELLSFRHPESLSRTVSLDRRIRATLDTLVNNTYSDETGNIVFNAQTQILLLQTLQQLFRDLEESEVPACKFLDNEADRDKIEKARDILLRHIGDPITIKALSRKVAINECYLKKGFKVMFGCTIFDYYQDQRMEHAKFLLYEKGKTVSEVSALLGYSSISHFSTAFKKHTGLKPCELLLR